MNDRPKKYPGIVQAAADNSQLDDACYYVQRMLGVDSGDLAGVIFSDVIQHDWETWSKDMRRLRMHEYVKAEMFYLTNS